MLDVWLWAMLHSHSMRRVWLIKQYRSTLSFDDCFPCPVIMRVGRVFQSRGSPIGSMGGRRRRPR